jgi:hypothetical protein
LDVLSFEKDFVAGSPLKRKMVIDDNSLFHSISLKVGIAKSF